MITLSNRCPENFTLDSNDTAVCTEWGNWSVARPRCFAPCTISSFVPNGYVNLLRVNASNLRRPVVDNSTTSFPIGFTAEPHVSNQLEKLVVLSGTRVQMAALMCKEGYVQRFPFDARCYDGRLSFPIEVQNLLSWVNVVLCSWILRLIHVYIILVCRAD